PPLAPAVFPWNVQPETVRVPLPSATAPPSPAAVLLTRKQAWSVRVPEGRPTAPPVPPLLPPVVFTPSMLRGTPPPWKTGPGPVPLTVSCAGPGPAMLTLEVTTRVLASVIVPPTAKTIVSPAAAAPSAWRSVLGPESARLVTVRVAGRDRS